VHFKDLRNRNISKEDLCYATKSFVSLSRCFHPCTPLQLITDKNTKRSKGMAYIEFKAQESVFLSISTLNGQLFMSMPVTVRASSVLKLNPTDPPPPL